MSYSNIAYIQFSALSIKYSISSERNYITKSSNQSITQYRQLLRIVMLDRLFSMFVEILLTVFIYQYLLVYVLLNIIRKNQYQRCGGIVKAIILFLERLYIYRLR